jgi:uncharacterized membrane protein
VLSVGSATPRGARLAALGSVPKTTSLRVLSGLGAAALVPPALLQLGLVRHLPDPRLVFAGRGFDSDRVNLSGDAFPFGVPDAPIGIASLLVNAALAGTVDPERRPLWTMAFASKIAIEAVVSAVLFVKMPTRERAWCGYCVVSSFASFGLLGTVLPLARRAWSVWRRKGAASSDTNAPSRLSSTPSVSVRSSTARA